jgi:molybdopterin-guanine dinucleotide biosynthesis protein A
MGTDKALLELDGETLLARSIRIVSAVVPELLIVGRTTLPSGMEGTPAIEDAYPGAGPLGGVATGLEHLGAERVLVVACDLPFLQVELLGLLLDLAPGYDAVVPVAGRSGPPGGENVSFGKPASGRAGTGARPYGGDSGAFEGGGERAGAGSVSTASEQTMLRRAQPTCAVYASSCLPVMRNRLADGEYKLRDVLRELRVRWVKEDEIRRVDPECISFVNANTPEEWNQIEIEWASSPTDLRSTSRGMTSS